MTELRFRQVHLDFHTSQHVPGIGEAFDPDEFASALERARVNSVTCFARCHHGYIYYDTKRNPERRHPHLERNLLKEQIDACHARDIRVPIYVTVRWDHYTADEHADWLCITDKGAISGTPPYEAGFYRNLCVNSPYRDWLKGHVREILETLPTDGFFFDICFPVDCSCHYCRSGMIAEGKDPADPEVRRLYSLKVINEWKRDMTAFVRRFSKDCTIFYNAGHVGPRHREVASAFTHFELESLPSGGWGYMHFPSTIRYARNLGLDCMGMTGKFHTSWGDFHSFKNRPALEFECFNMLALGAKCSVGDQLHPSGKICRATYDLIGSVYRQVEAKEPWCRGATPLVDVGVMTPEEFGGTGRRQGISESCMGATRLLQEGAVQFDILDSAGDFGKYKVLVLPDDIPVSGTLARKIEKHLARGGAVIASHKAGLDQKGLAFATDAFGVKLVGEAPFSPDFIVPKGPIGKGLARTEHVMYLKGMEVRPLKGAKVLADVNVPYFNRTFAHFCSHRHTPSAGKKGHPGIVRKGSVIYFAHPVFMQYHKNAPLWCKRLVLNALDLLLPEPLVRLEAPSSALAMLNEQAAENRLVLHLLHYIPERRGTDFDVIEDVIPIFDVKASVRVDRKVRAVACVSHNRPLGFSQTEGRVEFVLPKLEGHQIIVMELV
jgi:hypothetical protein